MKDAMRNEFGVPAVVDRSTFQAELDALRVREKAHTREGDTNAAARRRLPIVEVDGATPLIGERGAVTLLDVFEGRWMLIAGSDVFETYWTTRRGVEAMDNSYRLLDLTVYERQETWEDSLTGWPQRFTGKQAIRTDGRPTAQWSRLKARYADDLGTGRALNRAYPK